MNERLQVDQINIDEISDIGSIIPPGRYVAKVSACNPKSSKAGNDMVEVVLDILEGENQGMDARMFFPLIITRSAKNGKLYSGGVSELKASCAAVGAPLPPNFTLEMSPMTWARILAERLGKKKLDILVYEETDKEGKARTRVKIVGKHTPEVAHVAAATTATSAASTNGVAATNTDPLAGLL